jgi:hypothetical protein
MAKTIMIQGISDELSDDEIRERLQKHLSILDLSINRDNTALHGVQAIVEVSEDPGVLDQIAERFDGMYVDGKRLRVRSMLY